MSDTPERRRRRRRSLNEVTTAVGWRGVLERLSERTVFYILCLALAFAPLAFGAVRPWSRDPMHLLALIALLFFALRLMAAERFTWVRTPLDLPLAVGTIYVVARYATSPIEWESRQEMLLVVMYAVMFFMTTQHLFRRERMNAVLWLLVVLAAGIAAYAMINRLRGVEMAWWLENKDYPGRSFGTFYCPNHFAGYLELILGVTVAQLFWSGRPAAARIVLAYAALLMLGGIALSLSRGGYLSTGGMMLFLVLAVSRGVSKRWWPALLLVGVVAVAGVLGVMQFGQIRVRFEHLEPNAGEGSRWWMWAAAVKMIADHPWFGVGPFLYNFRYGPYRLPEDQFVPEHVHNDYLQALTDYGIVGFVLMGLLVVVFLVSAWRIHRRWRQLERPDDLNWRWPYYLELDRAGRPAWVMGSVAAVLVYMAHSVVDFNLHITANALTLTVIMAIGMLADHSRHLTADGSSGAVTRPPVVTLVELGPLARWVPAGMIVLFVCGIGAVAVPNYAGYLLQRLAEKQRDAIKFDEALASAHRAWRWDPSNYYVARLLGELYLNEARRSFNQADALAEQSVAWYRKAEELNPFDADLVSRRGDALEFLGRWADVEHARLKAVELDPNYFFYHKKLGTFYFYRGKKDLAIRSFQRVVELTPHDSYSHNKLKALGSAPLPRKPQPKKP